MAPSKQIAGFLIGTALSSSLALAQESPEESEADSIGRAVDEILVVAPRPIGRIKTEIIYADKLMYRIFNTMTSDMRYKTYCKLASSAGTRRKTRVCLPNFEYGVLEEAFDDSSTWTSFRLPEAVLRRHRVVYREMMIDFAEKNSELKDAILDRANLERELRDTRAFVRQEKRDERSDKLIPLDSNRP